MILNIRIGNTDDHARNHAAFWDGRNRSWRPPTTCHPSKVRDPGAAGNGHRPRTVARQTGSALEQSVNGRGRARDYGLAPAEVEEMFDRQVHIIEDAWPEVVEVAELTTNQAVALKGRQIVNAFALE